MQFSEAYRWLVQGQRRQQLMCQMTQPITVRQLSRRLSVSQESYSYVLWELTVYELVHCLNPPARSSRVYWLTDLGLRCQQRLRRKNQMPDINFCFPTVPWPLYGKVCFRQRTAALKAMSGNLQPVQVKRVARFQNPDLRMSANNVRDVIQFFLRKDIVRRVMVSGKAHPRYELTQLGMNLQRLLITAEGLPM